MPLDKIQVLIADDHQMIIKGIRSSLSEIQELEVAAEALNGREAVRLAETLQPDILILDISLPALSGLDVTARVRKLSPDTRIVIYTMIADPEMIARLLKFEVSAFVLKSDPESELIHAVRAVSRRGSYYNQEAQEVLAGLMKRKKPGKTDPFDMLSPREREVFHQLAEGKNVREIAETLRISIKTVETHKYKIFAKLRLHTITDLVKVAIKKSIISLD